MAVVKKRKLFKLGRSKVLTLPKDWSTAMGEEVTVFLDRIGLIVPPGLSVEELRRDFEKLLWAVEKAQEKSAGNRSRRSNT
ncbi:MAG: hypothetical protein QXT14_02955 [Candidatus Bathyarchaeia archaeon]